MDRSFTSPPGIALAVLILAALATLAAPPAGAAPSCAEGPETVGATTYGTPCDDVIRLPRAVTTVYGEGGDDVLYGQRGNDRLYGGEGADRLYGGIGDDRLRGGPGDDLLSGGFGADSLDGEAGDDLARGDATIDWLLDTGGDGGDVLSFATGVTPGFPNESPFFTDAGFPAGAEGRGVYVDLEAGFANNGLAPTGGGVDGPLEPATDLASFEVVIGTPFPDYIVGTSGAETFYGGGGADLIDGRGGGDVAHGGAGGDGCVGVAVADCEFEEARIETRDPEAIVAGTMAPGAGGAPALYLTGSDGADRVTAAYAPGALTFRLAPDSEGAFDPDPGEASGCQPPSGVELVCPLGATPDSILLAGLDGEDSLRVSGLPASVSLVLLGGEDGDSLTGADTEDALVDGAGDDVVAGLGGDDALPNNGGADALDAGPGEDLFVSNAVCDGDSLEGGADRDNANWANFEPGVAIDMSRGVAGLVGSDGEPSCSGSGGALTTLAGIEDIEGTNGPDNLVGDGGPNQILGRDGPDNYRAGAGNDFLLANSGDSDSLLDCGADFDTALIDFPTPTYADPAPIGCESVEERAVNSFRPPDTPPDPDPSPPLLEPPPAPPAPLPDTTAPRASLRHRPPARLDLRRAPRRVAFRFAAEPGSRFLCRLDRRPLRPCASPRAYRVGFGRHVFRVFAVDPAGNRDRAGAQAIFQVDRVVSRLRTDHGRRR